MNDKVGFKEVQAYAQKHNIDFKTAAKKLGLSDKEAQALSESMTGNVNWGQVMDEVTFNPAKAKEYEAMAAEAQRRDVENNPEKYEEKKYTLTSGRYIVYQKDPETGKDSYKYYAQDGTQLKESYFKEQENLGDKTLTVNDKGHLVIGKKQEDFFKFTNENGNFSLAETGKTVAKTVFACTLGLFASCADDIDQSVTIINDNSSLEGALDALLKGQEVTNSTLAAILEREIANGTTLTEILALVGDNQEVLQRILDAMTENNTLLGNIAADITEGNEAILDALIQIKNSVDVLTELAAETNAKIPDDLKGDLTAILNAIKEGNTSLEEISGNIDSLAAKLAEVSDDIKANGKTQEEIKEILEQIQSGQLSDSEKLLLMLDLLKSIESIGVEINEKLDEIIQTITDIKNKMNDDKVSEALDQLLALVVENNEKADVTNELLEKLISMYEKSGLTKEDLADIINAIASNGDKIDETNQMLAKIQDQDEKFQAAVLNALKNLEDISMNIFNQVVDMANGNTDKFNQLMQMLAKMQDQDEKYQTGILEAIKNLGDASIEVLNDILNKVIQSSDDDKEQAEQMEAILQILQNIQAQAAEFQTAVLNELKNLGDISMNIFNKIVDAANGDVENFNQIMQMLAKMQDQDEKYQTAMLEAIKNLGDTSIEILNKVIESVNGNTEQMDAIVQLLAKIDSNIQQYGEAGKELGNKILAAIENLGADISGKLTQILNVANQDADNGKNIQDLLNKVLSKMDENTQAIIDAIAKIQVGEGGNVDLSSLEKMLSELLELTAKNNGLLESIDGKMDVINLTIERAKEEILAKMDKNDANTTAILAKLDEFMNLSDANSEEILKKMDTIINVLNNIKDQTYDDSALMAKLDDILAAIKDHNVTVDITGKVTCECNCGGNHEGIIGDLEDILG